MEKYKELLTGLEEISKKTWYKYTYRNRNWKWDNYHQHTSIMHFSR